MCTRRLRYILKITIKLKYFKLLNKLHTTLILVYISDKISPIRNLSLLKKINV